MRILPGEGGGGGGAGDLEFSGGAEILSWQAKSGDLHLNKGPYFLQEQADKQKKKFITFAGGGGGGGNKNNEISMI